jgi:threonine dehydratase
MAANLAFYLTKYRFMQHPTADAQPTFEQIEIAHRSIARHIVKTPVVSDPGLNELLGCDLYLKCENFQGIGAFKIRGAMNAILSLRERGIGADVATHSSGNHGAAVAAAATLDGRGAVIVMPDNAVEVKVHNVQRHGGEVRFCPATQSAREDGLQRLVDDGLVPIHPYDHHEIICGQGTAALEMLRQQPGLDILLAPVGGGGLIAGCSIAAKRLIPGIRVIGAEPLGAADTAESLRRGTRVESWTPDTIADGLRALVGEFTFPIIHELVDDVLTVSEDAILTGMDYVWDTLDMLIEPSSATVIAAIMEHPECFRGRSVGAIISGGNVDLQDFPQYSENHV